MKALQLRLVLHTCKKEAQLSRNYDLTVLARVPKVVWFQQLSRIATQLSRNCDQTVLARIPKIVLISTIVLHCNRTATTLHKCIVTACACVGVSLSVSMSLRKLLRHLVQ